MQITAEERKEQGTSASRRLRREGKVPGIIYGYGEARAITLDHNELWHAMRKEGAQTSIIELQVDGKKTPTVVRDIQYHVYKPFITHIDFMRVDMKSTMVMRVPLHLINADESPAVKADGNIINHIITELEIECLPVDLPESITVDLANLEAGGSITISQIKLPKGVKLVESGDEEDHVILTAVAPAVEAAESDDAAPEAAAPAAEGETE